MFVAASAFSIVCDALLPATLNVTTPAVSAMSVRGRASMLPPHALSVCDVTEAVPGNESPARVEAVATPSASTRSTRWWAASLLTALVAQTPPSKSTCHISMPWPGIYLSQPCCWRFSSKKYSWACEVFTIPAMPDDRGSSVASQASVISTGDSQPRAVRSKAE